MRVFLYSFFMTVSILLTAAFPQTPMIEDKIRDGETSTAELIVSTHPRLWVKGSWDWNYNNVGSFAWRIIHGEEKPWPWETDPANDQEKQEFSYVTGADGSDTYGADNMYKNYHHDFGRRVLEPIISGKAQKYVWGDIYHAQYSMTYDLSHTADEYFSDAREKLLYLVNISPNYEYPYVVAFLASVAYDWLVDETYTNGTPILSEADKSTIISRLFVHGDALFNEADGKGDPFNAIDTDNYFYAMIGMALYEPSRINDPGYSEINAKAKLYLDTFDSDFIGKILPVWNEQGGDGGWFPGLTEVGFPYWLGGLLESDDNCGPLMIAPVMFAHYTATDTKFEESLFNTGILKYFAEFQLHMIEPNTLGDFDGSRYFEIEGTNSADARSPWINPMRAYARRRFSSDNEQKRIGELGAWIRTEYNKEFTDYGSWDMLEQLLFEDKWVSPRDPQSIGFPTTRFFEKLGWVSMRSGFTNPDDIAALFICQRYHWNKLNPYSQNSLTLKYKGDLLEGLNNTLYFNGKGQRQITQKPVISQGISAFTPNSSFDIGPGISKFEDTQTYAFIYGDATKAYDQTDLKKYSRQIAYLKPDIFILFDHVITSSPTVTKSWVVDPISTPQSMSSHLYTISNGKGMLWINRLLPENVNIVSQTTSRFEVTPAQSLSEDYFLNIFQVTDAGIDQDNPAVIADDAELVEQGDSVGVKIGAYLVLFSKNDTTDIVVTTATESSQELKAINGTISNNSVTLEWVTVPGIYYHGFEVERSANGINYSSISFIKSKSDNSIEQSYQYMDANILPGNYFYRLKMWYVDGSFQYSKIVQVNDLLPQGFKLFQNRPNPFNPSTEIGFSLSESAHIDLSVFDVTGRKVVTLLDDWLTPGYDSVTWNGKDENGNTVASGIYFYRLLTRGKAVTKKMQLLH